MRTVEMKKEFPLPWKHDTHAKNMSAVVAANGHVVAGSLICQQFHKPTAMIQAHALIVKSANESLKPNPNKK